MSEWKREKALCEDQDGPVILEREYLADRPLNNYRIVVYMDGSYEDSIIFKYVTEEMYSFSRQTWFQICRTIDVEKRRSFGNGKEVGEQKMVDQVHRLIGVDKIVNQIADSFGSHY